MIPLSSVLNMDIARGCSAQLFWKKKKILTLFSSKLEHMLTTAA